MNLNFQERHSIDLDRKEDKIKHKAIKTYKYGSRVYGTHNENSDYDYIVVVEGNDRFGYDVEIKGDNFKVLSEAMFIELIKDHEISVLECIFQDKDDEYLKYFELNLSQLRMMISGKTSVSYVKCKKKLIDGEVYIGLKSLFHSLRILDFGIQIAKHGKIKDYSSSNSLLNVIMYIGNDWDKLDKTFKPIHNAMKSQFKILAPKGD